MFEYILIALSFVIGLLCIRHLRSFDVHEQEPFGMMLAVTLWGGFVSVALSLFLYELLQINGISIRNGFPFSYIYIGLTEELAKLAALFLCWPIIRNEMDEPTDGPIYIACVALGFSLIENYFYALAQPQITYLIAVRLVICTPMHIAFSLFMGLAFFWAMRFRGGWGILMLAYLAASIYHTLYDIVVTVPSFLAGTFGLLLGFMVVPLGLFVILRTAYSTMYRLLGYTAAYSPFRQTLAEFIHSCPDPEVEPGFQCIECTNAAPKPTYQRGRIRIQRCEQCGTYLCSAHSLRHLVHHYGSLFGSLKRYTKRIPGYTRCRVIIAGNRIDLHRHTACFKLDEFNEVLEKTSHDLARNLERTWWFPLRTVSEEG